MNELTKDELTHVLKAVSLLDLSDCEFEYTVDDFICFVNALKNGNVIDAIMWDGNIFKMMDNGGGFHQLSPMTDGFTALFSFPNQALSISEIDKIKELIKPWQKMERNIDDYTSAKNDRQRERAMAKGIEIRETMEDNLKKLVKLLYDRNEPMRYTVNQIKKFVQTELYKLIIDGYFDDMGERQKDKLNSFIEYNIIRFAN